MSVWRFHLHLHRQPCHSLSLLCTICLPNAAGQLLHPSEHLHPDGHWLVHGTKETVLSCTLERGQPGRSSAGHTHLLTAAGPMPQYLARHARLWGHTYSEVDFFDRGYWKQWYTCISIHALSLNQSSHFPDMEIYRLKHTDILGEYVTQYLSSPKANSTSLHIKSGSRTECWLYAKKWSTYKERVRHDFCLVAAHKLCSDLRDGRPWQPEAPSPTASRK